MYILPTKWIRWVERKCRRPTTPTNVVSGPQLSARNSFKWVDPGCFASNHIPNSSSAVVCRPHLMSRFFSRPFRSFSPITGGGLDQHKSAPEDSNRSRSFST